MSASEGKADVFRFNFGSLRLNVRFSRKRTFRLAKTSCFEGPLTAISGHASDKENPAQTGVIDQRDDAQGRAAVWALEPIDFVDFLNQPRPARAGPPRATRRRRACASNDSSDRSSRSCRSRPADSRARTGHNRCERSHDGDHRRPGSARALALRWVG